MSESNEAPSIWVLPEGCISDILARTSPRDACRAASISKEFNLASDSDAVWERFLPPDYRQVIARAVSPVVFESKKQLYHRLSDSYILLDGDCLGFKLCKESGKKCYMVGAKELSIAWGNDTRYWDWGQVSESRFAEVAILRRVWWLDIHGKLPSVLLSPKTTYAAYLVFRIIGDSWGLSGPGKTIVSFGGVRNETSNVCLQQPRAGERTRALALPHAQVGERTRAHEHASRNGGWMEIELGEFYYHDGDEGEVEMAFQEHDEYKGGIIVEGIEIRPK